MCFQAFQASVAVSGCWYAAARASTVECAPSCIAVGSYWPICGLNQW